jgi:putative ABC transport system ATP-binding protein
MAPVVELTNVSRSFDDGRIVALRSVSLRIDEGESVALVGRSGSGKSTLLNLMCGLDRPNTGDIRFDGKKIVRKSEWTRIRATSVGIIFQNFCLIPTLSVLQNIELAALARGETSSRVRARIAELLKTVGLADRRNELPGRLSGGERQRVGIIRALVNQPSLILADEPTGSLDRATGEQILALLAEVRTRFKAALVLITHEPTDALICQRRVELADGRLAVQAGTASHQP